MVSKSEIYDVIIIGGGVIGISIAYKLSKSNIRCAVIEKNYLGNGATQAAAGVISPLFYGDDQINSPMRQIRELSYEMFLKLEDEFEELEIECPFNKTGIFRTAFDDKELELLKKLSDITSKLGVKSELVIDRKQKNELNFLSEEIRGGMFFPDEGYVDGLDFVGKLKSAILKMGSDIFENEEFLDFKIENDNTNQIMTSKRNFFANNIFFDEKFFMYLENVDLCLRAKKDSGKLLIITNSKIRHLGAQAVDNKYIEEVELSRNWHWMWSKLYFNKKHRGFFISMLLGFISLIGNFLKFSIYMITFNKKRNIYRMRMSGIINSFLGKQSWYRPEIN